MQKKQISSFVVRNVAVGFVKVPILEPLVRSLEMQAVEELLRVSKALLGHCSFLDSSKLKEDSCREPCQELDEALEVIRKVENGELE